MFVQVGVAFRSIFYAPFYVALNRGLFADEGMDVIDRVLGDRVVDALAASEIDLAMGGIMRSLLAYDRQMDVIPVHIARMNDRDGFFLLGRHPEFDWADLLGRSLIIFSEALTPWYTLRAALRLRGLDADRIRVIEGIPSERVGEIFRSGEADFAEAPAQQAEQLVAEGTAVILRSMGEVLGPIPYSSYYTLPGTWESRPGWGEPLLRAHVRALRWMRDSSGDKIWSAIQPSFPSADPVISCRAVERYRAQGTWPAEPAVSMDGYQRLGELLVRGGLISRIAPYDRVCRTQMAETL